MGQGSIGCGRNRVRWTAMAAQEVKARDNESKGTRVIGVAVDEGTGQRGIR